jgi:hypothetical protein
MHPSWEEHFSPRLPHPLQPQRISSRLRIPSNPLTTRQVFVFDLLGLPLVVVFDLFLHVRGGFAGWYSDLAGNVAHGGPEDCFQAAADGVADGVEEAYGRLLGWLVWLGCFGLERGMGRCLPSPLARGPSGAMGMVVVVLLWCGVVWCSCWLSRYLLDSSRVPDSDVYVQE